MNQKATSEKKELQSQIDDLEKKVESLESIAAVEDEAITQTPTSSSTTEFVHKSLGFSFELPVGYIVSDSYNCEDTCTANITTSKKVSEIAYDDTAINIIYNKLGDTVEKMLENEQGIENDNLGEEQIKIDDSDGLKVSVGGICDWLLLFRCQKWL